MKLRICRDACEMGRLAAAEAAERIRQAIQARGTANIVVATGASQFEVLAALVAENIEWPKVVGFHLDEYIGLSETHPASFRNYLRKRLVDLVPFRAFHFINGEADPEAECRRVGQLISAHPTDVALVGIGENGHLAFNDPPADFETEQPYIIVELDEACRRQQLGEGWFASFDEVPRCAISMSIRQIMKSQAIICSVPDRRKAEALRAAVAGPVTPLVPASILQQHPQVTIYVDPPAAELLTQTEKWP